MKKISLSHNLIILTLISILSLFFNKKLFKIIFSIIWAIVTVLVVYASIHYTRKYKFLQFNIKEIIKSLKKDKNKKDGITSLEALTMQMAEKIGIGSISGCAIAIYYGGFGTIFWIIIFTILVSIISYVEATLGIKYQIKNNSFCYGGPTYYINNILHNKSLGKLYALFIIISYSGIFLAIQSNTIAWSINYSFNIDKSIIIFFIILSSMVIYLKNIKIITKITSVLVPFMLFIYLIISLFIIFSNINLIPSIIKNIFISAFNIKSGLSGLLFTIVISLQRTIFATESGIGTTAIASSLTTSNMNTQGMLSIFSVYVTTFIIILATFFIIATSNYPSLLLTDINGIELSLYAFNYHLGSFGTIILSLIIILFAYSTIISGYFLGEINLKIFKFFEGKSLVIFKSLAIFIIFLGTIVSPNIIWNLVDLFIAMLFIINIISMLKITK